MSKIILFYFTLGVALGFNAQFDEAVNALNDAINVLEKRVANLKEKKESRGKHFWNFTFGGFDKKAVHSKNCTLYLDFHYCHFTNSLFFIKNRNYKKVVFTKKSKL